MIEVDSAPICDDAARQCHFGLCRREAELAVTLSDTIAPVQVCSLHLSPILGWGVPQPVERPVIRYLSSRPEHAQRPHEAA